MKIGAMKTRLLWVALFAVLCAPVAFAANESADKGAPNEQASDEGGSSLVLKWANFGLLALGLGYLVMKTAPAFFNARTDEIQKAIKDATGLKMEADFRASEVDRKMATLGTEIDKLRSESQAEMAAEHERLRNETELTVGRINEHVRQEVASLRQNSAKELRRHVADLAASMASSRLRDHLTVDEQMQLIRSFADRVRAGAL
jgi:F0F1-type ATP synthase membrane subunit b/b'